ncbi:hypothetical protein U6G28_00395 [Actinomycetaceae bacterium MB13-C1-2]|nr:hypothetical protein U6G28_00395 [Actinomycetaceae bacterium MB13-C1-2]
MPTIQAGDANPRPDNDCPPWCEGRHRDLNGKLQGSDRTHALSAGLQPVIAGAVTSGDPMEAYPTEFDVLRYQGHGDKEEWVFIGDDDIGWCVTIESASRIYRALGAVLAGADPY